MPKSKNPKIKKITSNRTINFKTRDPRRNLPSKIGRKRGESNFVSAFEHTYTQPKNTYGIKAKQFALAGFGIADFVSITWPANKTQLNLVKDSFFMAFEMKLQDWRQAVSQAYKYSYFADLSIVVLPPPAAKLASLNLENFKKTGIGLWEFDSKKSIIKKIYTPTKQKNKTYSKKQKALASVFRKLKFSEFNK
jgi:hypothetical protein